MNTLAHRVLDFLKEYRPFKDISYEDLLKISSQVKVLNFEKNQTVFQINDSLHDSFYIIASGVVNLSIISDAEETLLNKCYIGDIFGLRPFFAKNNYQMTAKAREESILYAIPIESFKPFVLHNEKVLEYLLESFAKNSRNGYDSDLTNNVLSDSVTFNDKQQDLLFFQNLIYNKQVVEISNNTSIKDAATALTQNMQDAAIVVENGFPVGIITDKLFRAKVVTGKVSANQNVSEIMASPVITVLENISVAEAQLIMLKNNVSYLCVTLDGTNKSEVKGIISEHDLVVAQSNSPGVLLKEIKKAQTSRELKQVRDKMTDIIQSSIEKEIPLMHTQSLSGELTLAIIKRAIEQSILDYGSPPARFAWLSLGSQGRKEQLLLTDQDSMLVFEDVPESKYRDVKDYFVKLAKKTVATLEKIGYNPCPYNHMASNLHWCKSLSEWTKQYNSWMLNPAENLNSISSIFFDYELAYGEQSIEDILNENTFRNLKNNTVFFDYLGNEALKKPAPLNFFKKLTLEEDGEFKGKFDIKTKALSPLIDVARLMVMHLGIKGFNNTYLRYKQLAITDAVYAETYLACAQAFLFISKLRTIEGLKNDSDGSYISVDELSKSDKEKLKENLELLKDLEEMVKDRFQLTQFS